MRFGNFATKLLEMQIPGFSTVMLDATCYMLTTNKTQHVTTVLHLGNDCLGLNMAVKVKFIQTLRTTQANVT